MTNEKTKEEPKKDKDKKDKKPIFSASKLIKYIECPRMYKDLYDNEWSDDNDGAFDSEKHKSKQENSVAADGGKLVHRVLELAAKKRIGKSKEERDKVTKDELFAHLEQVTLEVPRGQDDWKDATRITPETVQFAKDTLAFCVKRLTFIHTIEVERKFDIDFGTIRSPQSGMDLLRDAKVRGSIDRVDEMPDGTIRVIDYKTGFLFMSYTEAMNDPQINLYLVACARIWPGRVVEMELHYLNRNQKLGPIRFDPKLETERLMTVTAAMYKSHKWKLFPETPGMPHCGSCHRRGVCRSYAMKTQGELAPANGPIGWGLELFNQLKFLEKRVEEGLKTLKPHINVAVNGAEDGEVFGTGRDGASYRGRLVCRGRSDYQDGKRLSMDLATFVCGQQQKAPKPEEPIPEGEALAQAYVALKARYAKLEEAMRLVRTAFNVSVAIAKPQSQLVDRFVEDLPKEQIPEAYQVCERHCVSASTYYVEVEKIEDPFPSIEPTPEEVAFAETQAAEIAAAKRLELGMNEEPKANDEVPAPEPKPEPKPTPKPPAKPKAPITVEAPPSKPVEQTSLFGDQAPAATPASTQAVASTQAAKTPPAKSAEATKPAPAPAKSAEAAKPAAPKSVPAKPAAAPPATKSVESMQFETSARPDGFPDCMSCKGTGKNSKGGQCHPCANRDLSVNPVKSLAAQ